MSNYSPRTKYEYRSTLKKFYKWLRNSDTPEEVSWIKLNFKKCNDKLPSELLTEEDVLTMLNQTINPRDRAIIISLYESGCRIGEFLKIQIKDVTPDKYGVILNVTGKTGGRRVRIITAAPYIFEWINKHPDKENPQAFVWLKHNTHEMLPYPALCKLLRVAAKRADIKKKVNPHSFRHARATQLASKLTEQQLKLYFGWTRSSDMASVYVHLSGRDVNNALLATYGIQADDSQDTIQKITPTTCGRCSQSNEPTNKYCKQCGFPLNEAAQETILKNEFDQKNIDAVMNTLLKDKDILKLFAQKIQEKGEELSFSP